MLILIQYDEQGGQKVVLLWPNTLTWKLIIRHAKQSVFEILYIPITMQNCQCAFLAVSLAISYNEAFWHTLQLLFSSWMRREDAVHWERTMSAWHDWIALTFTYMRMKLATQCHPMPRLRMSGGVPQLHLHAFMAWTWKTPPYLLPLQYGMWLNPKIQNWAIIAHVYW
jgi:hypothetical protein